jgi:putative aminopeptidase FrvX
VGYVVPDLYSQASPDFLEAFHELTLLTQSVGPSGFERDVVQLIEARLQSERAVLDAMGNLVVSFGPTDSGDRIVLLAHSDEVSYVITHIARSGLAFAAPNGLVLPAVGLGSFVQVVGHEQAVAGVAIAPPAHLSTGLPDTSAGLWIHLGADGADEVEQLGLRIGDPVCYDTPCKRLAGGRIAGKSLDNRAGCAVLMQLARLLAVTSPRTRVDLAFTAQEETGSRGAEVVIRRLEPDVVIVVDTVSANDGVYVSPPSGNVRLGGGPAIRSFDLFQGRRGIGTRGVAYSRPLAALAVAEAEKHGIPFQRDAAATWTDAAWGCSALTVGVPTVGLFIPRLGSHSAVEIIDLADFQACSNLARVLVEVIGELGTQRFLKAW